LLACSPEPELLRVGVNPWPGYETIYLAQKLGYFREAGVDVRLVEFASLADARRSFERNQIDALASTVVEVLRAREQSQRSLRIVQVLDYSNGADMLVARAGLMSRLSAAGAWGSSSRQWACMC
jgi:NitT/TauT family transport system substrate-binding protein